MAWAAEGEAEAGVTVGVGAQADVAGEPRAWGWKVGEGRGGVGGAAGGVAAQAGSMAKSRRGL